MGKIERRQKLKARRERKQIETLQTSGRLIEENHNGHDYTPEYTSRVVAWRFFELWMKTQKYKEEPGRLWEYFGRLREGLQTLLLHWPDDLLGRGSEFWFIYDLLGNWRRGDKEGLVRRLKEKFLGFRDWGEVSRVMGELIDGITDKYYGVSPRP